MMNPLSRQSTERDDLTRSLFASMVLVITKGQTMNIKLTAAQLRRLADIKDEIATLTSEFDTIATTGTPVSMPPPLSVHRGGQWTPERMRKFKRTMRLKREGKL